MNLLSPTPSNLPSTAIFSTLSPEQKACVDHIQTSRQSLIIPSCAGSGKSYCLEALMVAINHTYPGATIALLSFNTSVAEELTRKVQARGILNCTVGTAHRFGKLICESFLRKRVIINKFKLSDHLKVFCPKHLRWPEQKIIIDFVSMCKDVGIGIDIPMSLESLTALRNHHDIELPEKKLPASVFYELALRLIRSSHADTSKIDISDLIYMPLAHKWPTNKTYDFIIIDEAQDINATRRALISHLSKPSSTIIAVGDESQAIYGFTGADVDALSLLTKHFSAHTIPLTYSRRCSRAVIRHAQRTVPTINHLPDAVEGSVTTINYPSFTQRLRVEDHSTSAVLCRKNAPLFSLALELLRSDIPCRFEGTDILDKLIRLIEKLEATSIPSLLTSLTNHEQQQSLKLSPYRLAELQDQVSCIRQFAMISNSLPQLRASLSALFSPHNPASPRLTLSSIHKSKGLEWPTVFLLGRNAWMPSPFATLPWMQRQESNLLYVAITRAITHLVEVTVPLD